MFTFFCRVSILTGLASCLPFYLQPSLFTAPPLLPGVYFHPFRHQSRPPAKPEACSALKGHNTGGAESPPNHLPTVSGHKLLSGWLFSASFHWLTRKRVYQFFYSHLFIHYIFLHLIPYVFSYCLFVLRYLHNILYTNTLCFRFGILCLHVGQISSGYFFLLSIP